MYVCICRAVREQEVREAIARGADDLGALARELNLATGCGRCAESAQRILSQARSRPAAAIAG